jgi:hypothetical protein
MCSQLVACAGDMTEDGAVEEVATDALAAAADGWTMLLDGSTLDGWDVVGDSNWTVGDGFVEATSGGIGYLVTPVSYGDFELRVEFWVNNIANSGVFIRCADPAEIGDTSAYEVNIYDTRPDQTGRTGSIVNFAPPSEVIDAGGQWNTFEIRAEGEQLVVVMNGTETVNFEDSTYAEGPIALQYGAGIVRFRNVQIREL